MGCKGSRVRISPSRPIIPNSPPPLAARAPGSERRPVEDHRTVVSPVEPPVHPIVLDIHVDRKQAVSNPESEPRPRLPGQRTPVALQVTVVVVDGQREELR